MEFYQALQALGFGLSSDSEKIFNRFDPDGDGNIDYVELNEKIRQVCRYKGSI